MKKTWTWAVTAVLVAAVAWAEPSESIHTLAVEEGSQKVLRIKDIQRVAVGDADVMDVKTLGEDELLVIGTHPGVTTLIVWAKSGERFTYDVTVGQAAAPQVDGQMLLRVGMQRVISIKGMQRVAVGDAAVADVKTIGNDQLLIIASSAGRTTLIVWLADGTRKTWAVSVVGAATPLLPADAGVALHDVTPAPSETLKLDVKKSQSRVVPGLERLAIGDANIADIRVDGEKVEVSGIAPGHTMMLLWLKDGRRLAWNVEVSAP